MTKKILLAGILCGILSSTAWGQNSGCAAVSDDRERLACFNKKKLSDSDKADLLQDHKPGAAMQLIEDENKRVSAKMKTM